MSGVVYQSTVVAVALVGFIGLVSVHVPVLLANQPISDGLQEQEHIETMIHVTYAPDSFDRTEIGQHSEHIAHTKPSTQPDSQKVRSTGCRVNMGRWCTTDEAAILDRANVTSGYHEILASEIDFQSMGFQVTYNREQIYNPATVVVDNRLWIIVRHEGKNTSHNYATCPNTSMFNTRPCPVDELRMISTVLRAPLTTLQNGTILLSDHFECLDYDFKWDRVASKRSERELGPEDPRVFEWDGDVYVAVNGPPIRTLTKSPKTIRNMKVQRIFSTDGPAVDLELADVAMERYEKNWSPIAPATSHIAVSGGYLFARTVEPHQVLSCDKLGSCTTVATTSCATFFAKFSTLWNVEKFHLGTNVIDIGNNKLLGVLHALVPTIEKYLNFVYVIRATYPWEILGVATEPLRLPLGIFNTGYAFSSNIAWLGDRIAISYGVKDRVASVFITTLEEMTAHVINVTHSKVQSVDLPK